MMSLNFNSLKKIYVKVNDDNIYTPNGKYKVLEDIIGVVPAYCVSEAGSMEYCPLFEGAQNEEGKVIPQYIEPSSSIKTFDPNFVTQPIWRDKVYKGGKECIPGRAYDMKVLGALDYLVSPRYSLCAENTLSVTLGAQAGIILMTGGGGGGGGGDSGGWLDEPSGGGGGGSGGSAIVYYRSKKLLGSHDHNRKLMVKFGTATDTNAGNYQGSGGAAQSSGGAGATAHLVYSDYGTETVLISCLGGGGGTGSDTSNTTGGGGGGGVNWSGSIVVLDNEDYYVYVLFVAGGATGQSSGEGGASGNASAVPQYTVNYPSMQNRVLTVGGYSGGAGGKKNQDDPGGGGGAGSIISNGGNGSTGDYSAGAGSYGAGGGGGSERSTGGAAGGYAAVLVYEV